MITNNNSPGTGDHRGIKDGVGAGNRDNVKISPNGDVWVERPDGSWTNEGPASSYTGSGKASGEKGKDRENRGGDNSSSNNSSESDNSSKMCPNEDCQDKVLGTVTYRNTVYAVVMSCLGVITYIILSAF
jgi:hypothetical protein